MEAGAERRQRETTESHVSTSYPGSRKVPCHEMARELVVLAENATASERELGSASSSLVAAAVSSLGRALICASICVSKPPPVGYGEGKTGVND